MIEFFQTIIDGYKQFISSYSWIALILAAVIICLMIWLCVSNHKKRKTIKSLRSQMAEERKFHEKRVEELSKPDDAFIELKKETEDEKANLNAKIQEQSSVIVKLHADISERESNIADLKKENDDLRELNAQMKKLNTILNANLKKYEKPASDDGLEDLPRSTLFMECRRLGIKDYVTKSNYEIAKLIREKRDDNKKQQD